MVKKKQYRKILPNEKFSGKGHAAHICKKCTRKSKARKSEEITITCICSVLSYDNLSRDNKDAGEFHPCRSERARSEALTVLFARPTSPTR